MSDEEEEPNTEEEPPKKGKAKAWAESLTVKQLVTGIIGVAALVGALAGLGSQVSGWLKTGLGISHLEGRVGRLESRVTRLQARLDARAALPDANGRLDDALPRVATALRESRKDRQRLTHATTRLATIHEFGLDARRARATAVEVQRSMRTDEPGSVRAGDDDPIASLEGL